ncbi:MAG: hypothetical protein J6B21_08960, partial [Oscillospiraceae bacterium]|nr:hypothetical protein [Oscillospiraceae bacterium]
LFLAARALRSKQGQAVFATGKDGESLPAHQRTDIQKMSVFCFLYPPNIAKSPEITDFRAFLFYCNKNC